MTTGNTPAFPCEVIGDRSVPPENDFIQTSVFTAKYPGMTLRDYFAAQYLNGCASRGVRVASSVAREAYVAADAMIAERNRRTPA